MIMERQVVV